MGRGAGGELWVRCIQPGQSEQVYRYDATLCDQKGELKIMP